MIQSFISSTMSNKPTILSSSIILLQSILINFKFSSSNPCTTSLSLLDFPLQILSHRLFLPIKIIDIILQIRRIKHMIFIISHTIIYTRILFFETCKCNLIGTSICITITMMWVHICDTKLTTLLFVTFVWVASCPFWF